MDIIHIPSRNGTNTYQVLVGTGYRPQEFHVVARSTIMALDIIGNYCEQHGLRNLCATQKELATLCAEGQTVDDFAAMHSLTKCGINDVYIIVNQINKL